jgi:hypothetical protein
MTSVLSSLPEVLEGLDHAADLVVAVGSIGGEDLDLADEELLLLGRELVPGLQHVVGQGVSFVSCGITPSASGSRKCARAACS